ncbi:GNAT family N-acetyltransferase [Paenibacillus selenitireducens]|uniref:GNAT family N-acetyltransferase n=1 Tax=Paenibacillus selenitireducens TaxID=1324314 RepID=A0A1T2X725_9BACL|nr:GNAT family N-acetyltransferase [Paenibacillus selenitireducens]OPA75383.1 GNAT family N-acetyltransferase [Paenibacillus selenitireducens]
MNEIVIQSVNRFNWERVLEIKLSPEQTAYVPTVMEGLAYAYIKPWDEALDPYVLCVGDQVIGFFYLSYTPGSKDNYWMGGFQMDIAFQGKGYGKKALHQIIEFILGEHPNAEILSLTVEKTNQVAIQLYEKLGFISKNYENLEGEMIYSKRIRY